MVKNLEEITIQEVDKLGSKLNNGLETLKSTLIPEQENKELNGYINQYMKMIGQFNMVVRDANSYLGDHIVKFYLTEDKDLTYRTIKKQSPGYI